MAGCTSLRRHGSQRGDDQEPPTMSIESLRSEVAELRRRLAEAEAAATRREAEAEYIRRQRQAEAERRRQDAVAARRTGGGTPVPRPTDDGRDRDPGGLRRHIRE